MKIKTRIFAGFLILGCFIGFMGFITIFQLETALFSLNLVNNKIDELNESNYLLSHATNIKYYDEVLTQSARNYVFTEDDKWRIRYFEAEPLLSEELTNALNLGSNIEKEFFNQVDEANNNLVAMELESIKLTQTGNREKAIIILESQEYWKNKNDYNLNLQKYLENRNLEHTTLMRESTIDVDKSMQTISDNIMFGIPVIGISIIAVVIVALVFAFLISKSITGPIKELQEQTSKVTLGNLNIKIAPKGDKEIVQLTNIFNSMIERIKKDSVEKLEIHTKLKKIEKAINASSFFAITDKNGIIKQVNTKFCESSKYSEQELIGKNHRILKSGHHSREFYRNLWDTITSGKVWDGEIKNKAKDGTYYWNDMVIVPFLDKNNKIQEYISIRRDITDRKKLQDETLKNEKLILMGKFSARLAHDLRNPLSIIKLTLENLKLLYGVDESKQKHFDKVDRSIDRIVHQVNDVLDFVRERPTILMKTKISEIILESLDSLVIPSTIKLILPENNVDITCDKNQLVTLLNNLILNAIQAIGGAGVIEVTVEENNDGIVIQVKDSGKGISKEDLDKIFDPLFTTKQTGTGLGLVSVKSIVDAHKGTISITSPPTIFRITLPKTLDLHFSSNVDSVYLHLS